MIILNLTQHQASAEQIAAGVVDLTEADARYVRAALTAESLEELDSENDLGTREDRAAIIADRAVIVASEIQDRQPDERIAAMIGGAPWLMAPLELELKERGFGVVYAFSRRVSEEQLQADGSVRKVNVFRHVGWVPA